MAPSATAVTAEPYGLSWPGKERARALALQPSVGTLRPCPVESVDWKTAENLFIEGDNLEVLKLLRSSYAGRVQLIYIDPPYNTGKDALYPDDYRARTGRSRRQSGRRGIDRRLLTNTQASGRWHSEWLSMIYPRLLLARELLSEDGVIMISIDDGELPGLRLVANEVFGEDKFLACLMWKSRQNKENRTVTGVSIDHEYVVCYGRRLRGAARDRSQYQNPDGDPRGAWASANMVGIATAERRPNLHYDLVDPATGINYGCPGMGWRYEPARMQRLIAEERILWPPKPAGRPRRKVFLDELDSKFTGFSSVVGKNLYTKHGTADLDELFDERIFSFPKPVELIAQLVEQGTTMDGLVLDFFAGSGTTGHAVLRQNLRDGGRRRFILVQLPEPLDPEHRDQQTAAAFCDRLGKPRTLAELTKERLRRAVAQLRAAGQRPITNAGFRVLKLEPPGDRSASPLGDRNADHHAR